jgi:hypothetical protein
MKEACNCHCHHTAQHVGQPGYGMQPNWAECSFNCSSSCKHCKPTTKKQCHEYKDGYFIQHYPCNHKPKQVSDWSKAFDEKFSNIQGPSANKHREKVKQFIKELLAQKEAIYRTYIGELEHELKARKQD